MPDRLADLKGDQRKVVNAWVRPARAALGDVGIPVRAGRTLPFIVGRQWNAPLGNYREQWFLIHPDTREIVFEGPARMVLIHGLQAYTEFEDRVERPIPLEPGPYGLVFALNRRLEGEFAVDAIDLSSAAA